MRQIGNYLNQNQLFLHGVFLNSQEISRNINSATGLTLYQARILMFTLSELIKT